MTIKKTVAIKRALVSVFDKSGLETLAKFLKSKGIEIISTGGSANALRKAKIPVTDISNVTGFPEILDGRVKTLHPKIHGALLARRNLKKHKNILKNYKIPRIDLVIANLYPFEKTIAAGKNFQTIMENIDIGGPAMIRAAAKNHEFLTVITDPKDYKILIEQLRKNRGSTSYHFRQQMALKAFTRTSTYDQKISQWMSLKKEEKFPDLLLINGKLQEKLRYGENPHQQGAFYSTDKARFGVSTAKQIQGKELSYNNFNDTDAAFELVSEFQSPAVAIIKHANPCGVAETKSVLSAYKKALSCDPISAFGGVIAVNQPLDSKTAKEIIKLFTEVIIAPKISAGAKKIFKRKKNIRVLETGGIPNSPNTQPQIKSLSGGLLIQDVDNGKVKKISIKTVTKRKPSKREMDDLLFAFTVCKHVKSNAIVYAKNKVTVGIGAGQMSRIDSAKIAVLKSEEAKNLANEKVSKTKDCVVASDAFFPFPDALLEIIKAGAKAVIQPGGSIKDKEVIKAANANRTAMVFTGMRHFKH